jgi:glycerol uptake facilitator-like aquaporin
MLKIWIRTLYVESTILKVSINSTNLLISALFFFKIVYYIMQKYLAEFLGTLFFVYVILATGNPLAIGAALAIVIFLSAGISGGHMNPAVSVVMAAKGRLSTTDLIPYIIAQIGGGLIALEIYKKWKP